jgi:CNP1-like family
MKSSVWLAGLLALALGCAHAQDKPEWVEGDVPPAPAFRTQGLVNFVVSTNSELSYGVDPSTVTVGQDGVIRYVMVASSRSGAVNALYEGLHCHRAEAKTYARWAPGSPGQWHQVATPEWRPLFGNFASRVALALARNGFCDGNTPNGTPANMLKALAQGGVMR